MIPYKSSSGKNSGVTAYSIGVDYVVVEFGGSECYVYSCKSEKETIIEKMKKLARACQGLSTFISQYDPKYEVSFSRPSTGKP